MQRSYVQCVPGGEGLETPPLLRCGPLCRTEPLRVGQAGPHQVDGSAQLRLGFGLETIGPCQAPVELVHASMKGAVKYQIRQDGTVRRGNRPQIGGKTGYIGEQVQRPERRENSPGGTTPWTFPVAWSTSTQLPALAMPLGNRCPLAVRAPSLYVHILCISTWVDGELQRSR